MYDAGLDHTVVVASDHGGALKSMLNQPKGLSTSVKEVVQKHNIFKNLCSMDALMLARCAHLGIVCEQCLLMGGVESNPGPMEKKL